MTMPQEELQRIVGYLQGQAAQRTLAELIERVREAIGELEQAARAVPVERFDLRAPGQEWSPRECLQHIVGSNLAVLEQIEAVLAGGTPAERGERSLPSARDELLELQRKAFEDAARRLADIDEHARTDVRWRHPFFGDLNWREWLLFLRIHSRDHARQLPTLVAA